MLNPVAKIALLTLVIGFATPAFAQMDDSTITEATSAILGAGKAAFQVSHLRQVPSVGVFSLSATPVSPASRMGNDIADLKIYADRYAGGVARLRHALAANPVTRQALQANGVNIGQVLGVSVGSSGSLRVFEN